MMENDELGVRIAMCKYIISILEGINNDSRQPSALEHYRWQLAKLESRLPNPPERVVGLKPASLSANIPNLGG
jgi:hypothetical protein